jgi:2-dehydropantoate 2-reductase
MKTVIVGAGAIGSLFAYFLARGKKDVAILDKYPDRAEFINREGIHVEGISGEHKVKVKAYSDPAKIDKADVVMICVKAPDTSEAVREILPLLKTDSMVVTLQNGLGNVERIAEIVGEDRTVGGTTAQGATLLESGHIRHAGEGETIIGEMSGKITDRLLALKNHLADCRIAVSVTDNLESLIWSKLVINVGINALTAITHLKNGELVNYDGTRFVMTQAVKEALEVIREKGIKLLYDNPIEKVESVCRATAGNVSSMLQDVLRKKKTEVAYINGAIVREASKMGLRAPVNAVLERLVLTIEASYEKQLF